MLPLGSQLLVHVLPLPIPRRNDRLLCLALLHLSFELPILSTFEPIRDHFHPKQHQLTAQRYREQLRQRFC